MALQNKMLQYELYFFEKLNSPIFKNEEYTEKALKILYVNYIKAYYQSYTVPNRKYKDYVYRKMLIQEYLKK